MIRTVIAPRLLTVLLLGAVSAYPSSIAVFDNFALPPGYKTSGVAGFSVGPLSTGGENITATRFYPSTDAYLASFDIPIWNVAGDTSTLMQFTLVGESAGVPGTTPIESFSLTLGPTFSFGVYSLQSFLNPLLDGGQPYWLVASSPDYVGWLYTTSNDTSGFAYYSPGSHPWWAQTPQVGGQTALRVLGTTDPEPTSLFLLGSGPSGVPGTTVPEPTSLFLLGSGLGGVAIAVWCKRSRTS